MPIRRRTLVEEGVWAVAEGGEEVRAAVRALWRFKFVSVTILALTLAGCALAVLAVPALHRTTVSYLLVEPAGASSRAQQQANPFLRFDDPSVLIATIEIRLDDAVRRENLRQRGAIGEYQVAPRGQPVENSPIADLTVGAPTRDAAIRTAEIVGAAFAEELKAVQVAEGATAKALITTVPIDRPVDVTPPGRLQRWLPALVLAAGSGLLLLAGHGLANRKHGAEQSISSTLRGSVQGGRHHRVRLKPLPGPPAAGPAAGPSSSPSPNPSAAAASVGLHPLGPLPAPLPEPIPAPVISEALRLKPSVRREEPAAAPATEPAPKSPGGPAGKPLPGPPVQSPRSAEVPASVPEAYPGG